jgi:hypothetical protein
MTVKKYKYYFKKPKSEIVKDVLKCLLVGGAICLASTSPCFVKEILKNYKRWRNYPKQKFSNTFYFLKRHGYIKIKRINNQLYISLTSEGKKKARWLQIDALKIQKPKRWDKKWRLVIFDIPQNKKIYREALRGKLKELGFKPLQKSIWICPFDCQAEVELLRDFFGLSENEMRLITAVDIGADKDLKGFFKLK